MKYKIVVEETYPELETEVNKLLKEGWKLQGGVSHSVAGIRYCFTQAIVK